VRHLYSQFISDVQERATPGYRSRIQQVLRGFWENGEYQKILDTLKDHPYVLAPNDMPFVRAICCEQLKDYAAAAAFFAAALQHLPEDAGRIFITAGHALHLSDENKLSEAWEYMQHILTAIPHPVSYITACLLRYHQASAATTPEEERSMSEDQVRYYSEAWTRYQQLPSRQQANETLRDFMTLCFEATAFGLLRLGREEEALGVCAKAIDFAPSMPHPRTVRGIITYPRDQAVEDFREAVRLGEDEYVPYYFLAHAALMRDNFGDVQIWTRRALSRQPKRVNEAELYAWLAIAEAYLGSDRNQVIQYFEKAQSLDPGNQEIRENAHLFRTTPTAPSIPKHAWNRRAIRGDPELHLACRQSHWYARTRPTEPIERELAEVFR
jgi:tetratricopeptide (TPR) repeat protein